MMHPAVDSDLQAEGGGGGRTLRNFVRGGSDPRSNHLLSNAFKHSALNTQSALNSGLPVAMLCLTLSR